MCCVLVLCLSSFSVLCTQCCQFLFVFVQCLVYPMLPVFVCLRSVSCVPNVSRFCLSSFSVLCTQCCQFLFVFVQCLVYPMLPVFVCLRSVSCVPNVARFCLSSFSVLCTQCCQFFWIVHPNSPSVFSQTCIQSRKISILIDKFAYFRILSCVPNIASFSGLFIVDCSVVFSNFY